ncbi:hypothetical protein H9L17_15585 [Thermomonas brevis]|uniref:Uncharacterized protein n=1 Tax=Thermomonas brevis TaxID=215691 RepID=A0A7G9QT83_9GAMM|nr:hypothetical protein [Thermomonas brevis]QNN46558.1 hypothetical protein H9L17_15585 [Thermomonas brevis]
MSAPRAVAAVLAADLRQRLRTPRFWLVVAGLAALMWWCFPAASEAYLTVSVGDGMRGRYSSAWIGMVAALMYSVTLSLAGFYLVRGTLVRDFETRTWQLLVATTMSRGAYLWAKWLSHLVVLLLVMAGGLIVGLAAQWLRAEDLRIDLLELVKPVLVLTVPSLALTSALAVWFDMVPWLRRSAGNVLFFVLYVALVAMGTSQADQRPGAAVPFPGDPHGLLLAEHDLSRDWPAIDAGKELGLSIGTQSLEGKRPVLLEWPRWTPDAGGLRARGFWFGLALVLLAMAVPLLDRCAAHVGSPGKARGDGARLRWLEALLTPLQRGPFGVLVAAELRLVLRPRRAWWWLLLLVALGVQAFAPAKAMAVAMIGAWVLALDVFARLILRERETRTAALVFTAPGMRLRLLAVRAAVGIGLAWALVLPALLRLALSQPSAALATLVAGLSIALWGLATGALFRNGRLFELLLLAAAYVGAQGALVLNVVVDPMATLRWHLFALPVAAVMLALGWRKPEAFAH